MLLKRTLALLECWHTVSRQSAIFLCILYYPSLLCHALSSVQLICVLLSPFLCSYCDSRAAEPSTRALVLHVLRNAVRVPSIAAELVRFHGVGGWLVSHLCGKDEHAALYAVPRTKLQFPMPVYARAPAHAHDSALLVLKVCCTAGCVCVCVCTGGVRSGVYVLASWKRGIAHAFVRLGNILFWSWFGLGKVLWRHCLGENRQPIRSVAF